MIEFYRDDCGGPERVHPIEYKRGRPKAHDADRVQLCAQALCLEEMLELAPGSIPLGALFYGRTRRRQVVPFDDVLRQHTFSAIERLRAMLDSGVTPRAVRDQKCDRCSLLNLCLPGGTGPDRSAARWFARSLAAAGRAPVPPGDERLSEDGG